MSDAYETPVTEEAGNPQIFYDAVAAVQHILDNTGLADVSDPSLRQFVDSLDQVCPYKNKLVFINGIGIVPSYGLHGEYLGDQASDTVGSTLAVRHNGAAIIKDPEDETHLLVVHQLLDGKEYGQEHLSRFAEYTRLLHYFMGSLVMMVSDVQEPLLNGSDYNTYTLNPEWNIVIEEQCKKMAAMVNSTGFLKKGRKAQIAALESRLDDTERATNIKSSVIELKAGYGYVIGYKGEKAQLTRIDLADEVFTGTCLGFSSLDIEYIRTKRPIRTISQRKDPLAGLCLVLDPEEEVRAKLHLNDGQAVIIPTGQDIIYQ